TCCTSKPRFSRLRANTPDRTGSVLHTRTTALSMAPHLLAHKRYAAATESVPDAGAACLYATRISAAGVPGTEGRERGPLCVGHPSQPGDVHALVASVSAQYSESVATCRGPQSDRPIETAAGDESRVATQRHAPNASSMSAQCCHWPCGGHVPYFHQP